LFLPFHDDSLGLVLSCKSLWIKASAND